jgi:hypothetical protein
MTARKRKPATTPPAGEAPDVPFEFEMAPSKYPRHLMARMVSEPGRTVARMASEMISELESNNTAEVSKMLHEHARTILIEQLRSRQPPATESEIMNECLAFEDAIRINSVTTRLAEIACIPPSDVYAFRNASQYFIKAARDLHSNERRRIEAGKELKGLVDDVSRLRKRLARFESALTELHWQVVSVNPSLRIQCAGPIDSGLEWAADKLEMGQYMEMTPQGVVVLTASAQIVPPITSVIRQPLSHLADAARIAKAGCSDRRHRNRLAHQLIIWLEGTAIKHGGGFTYNKNLHHGSLSEAMDLLSPHFPKGFFARSQLDFGQF